MGCFVQLQQRSRRYEVVAALDERHESLEPVAGLLGPTDGQLGLTCTKATTRTPLVPTRRSPRWPNDTEIRSSAPGAGSGSLGCLMHDGRFAEARDGICSLASRQRHRRGASAVRRNEARYLIAR